jgi:hypothetical protein
VRKKNKIDNARRKKIDEKGRWVRKRTLRISFSAKMIIGIATEQPPRSVEKEEKDVDLFTLSPKQASAVNWRRATA